jgi:hypothetical protein
METYITRTVSYYNDETSGLRVSSTIRENMTLGEDVGTSLEYCR